MRKLTAIAVAILLLFTTTKAQSFDTTQYYGKMNYAFQHVNKSLISSGLLRDYGIEFLNLDNYKGTTLHDSNYVGLEEWRLLYASLYSSQINSAGMLYLDTVNRLINKYNSGSMPVSFVSLYYNYQRLRDDAVSSNLIYVSNDKLYDVAGRSQSPYQNEELFAIAPIRQAITTGTTNLIFRPELFLSNSGKTVSSIAVDPNGGSSYQAVSWNTPFAVSYTSEGFYNVKIRITYTDGTTKYGQTKLAVHQTSNPAARYGTRPTTNEQVTATRPFAGIVGQGDITIDLARNNTTGQIRKPLIVVEGFDPNNDFVYDAPFGDDYVRRISVDINTPFNDPITLNDGLDDINEYDIIFLNYQNGTDFIQRNAFLLERVIEIVNDRKTTWNGTRQQNVIIGMSMGGLVARYALRDMELNSQNHDTRLFISHDAPHWGANVPVGAQAAVQHLAPWSIINAGGNFPFIRWVDMFPQVVDALALFNSPAARQMVIQRYSLSGQTLSANNTDHNNFLTEINNMGWPVNCRNSTISNGTCNGAPVFPDNSTIFTMDGSRSMSYLGSIWRSLLITLGAPFGGFITGGVPSFNAWAMAWQFPLSLYSTKSSIGVDFKIRAVPRTGTQEIYRGDVFSTKKLVGLINVKNYFIKSHVSSNSGMLALDNAPGGVYDLEEFGFDPNLIQNQLPAFFQGHIQASVLQPRFCFVPTVSSMDFVNPQQFLFSNICNNTICNMRGGIVDFFVPQQNQLHISYTQPSSDWILQRQNPAFNCITLCSVNLSISGGDVICSSSNYTLNGMPANATATWTPSVSGVVSITPITPNGSQVSVSRIGSGDVTLTASLNTCTGNASASKTVHLGGYSSSDYPVSGSTYASCGQTVYFSTNTLPGATSYDWFWPSSWYYVSGQGTPYLAVQIPSYESYGGMVGVRVANACDQGGSPGTLWVQVSCYGYYYYTVSPNPAYSDVKVSVKKEAKEAEKGLKKAITEIRIYDQQSILKKYKKYNKVIDATINVADLPTGVYIIEIVDGDSKERQQLSIVK